MGNDHLNYIPIPILLHFIISNINIVSLIHSLNYVPSFYHYSFEFAVIESTIIVIGVGYAIIRVNLTPISLQLNHFKAMQSLDCNPYLNPFSTAKVTLCLLCTT